MIHREVAAMVRRTAACVSLALACAGAHAQPAQDVRACGPAPEGARCADGPWSQFARMDLTLKATGFDADYAVRFPAGRDVYAKYDERSGTRRRQGEIIVVSDQAIAYRTDDERDPQREVDTQMLAGPLMMSQLASVLLQTGVPGGYKALSQPRQFAAKEAGRFILTSVPGAAALYGPPWSVTGTASRSSPMKITFSMRFTFTPVDPTGAVVSGKTETIALTGTALFPAKREALPDSFSIDGWKLERGGTELPELPALGALREYLLAN
jgi:hypothetical protein